jgi:inner membrane protein
MDSLTQLVLGAAVGEATLGRKVGRRAILWGAVCGTLPDLDVFVPLGDAVRDFTYHRSASHSVFVLAALTPLLVWLILKIHPQTRAHWRGWAALVYLVFLTHVLLDSLTVYGTQIFWPLTEYPVGLGSIFIIDPAYTLPLLGGVLAALIAGRRYPFGWRANTLGLTLSAAYLLWGVLAQQHVYAVARDSLAHQDIEYTQMLVVPTPFNSVLWRVLVMEPEGYREGFYSLLDTEPHVAMTRYASEPRLLSGIEDHWPVQRLQWFSKGFNRVSEQDGAVIITDLRMGMEPGYVFSFKVGSISNPHAVARPSEQLPPVRDWGRMSWLLERMQGVESPPAPDQAPPSSTVQRS